MGILRNYAVIPEQASTWRFQLYIIYVKYELTLPGIFVRIECTIERLYEQATGLNMTSSSKYNDVFHKVSPKLI